MARVYEQFKATAQRLVSATCDKCGAELWCAPGQPWARVVGIHPQRLLPEATRNLDLCVPCAEELDDLVRGWLGVPLLESGDPA